MLISCVLTECVTERSSGLLATKLCQVSPSLNDTNVHLVLLGTQAVGEGSQLPFFHWDLLNSLELDTDMYMYYNSKFKIRIIQTREMTRN